MTVEQKQIHTCPNCGTAIAENQYVMRSDGTFRCWNCYFNDTYLEGVVHRIDMAYLVTLEAFVNAIDAHEHEVGNHSLRVTEFSLIIANSCDVRGRDLVDLYCGALLHDIGKIGVPDAVLHKSGPLNAEEQAVMRKHPDIGYRIIGHIGYFSRAAEIIRSHHEHFDGSGYPRGLKGDAIPHGARVFAVADALDALTVSRPYRQALSFEASLEEIIRESGTVFDPSVIQAALRASDELKEYVGRIVFSGMAHDRDYKNDFER
ncbi:MAG TPA: HD-GYP domain-containing protein [Nitrospirota bacterium]|nr:HD-GYP domain-containing protein [Nitrospirota bacterium]